MHRALQITNAAKAAVEAAATTASVYQHRALSLSEDEQELPAISVRMGTDTPSDANGMGSMHFIDSLLELQIDLVARGDIEEDVLDSLLTLRALVHQALQADITLGLAFVTDTQYGGTSAPDIAAGARLAGGLSTRWVVRYRMNYTDPN